MNKETEIEYNVVGPDKDGDYECEDCGYVFKVRDGDPIECPICKQIYQPTEPLKPCPFCGSIHVILDWDVEDIPFQTRHRIMAMCTRCGSATGRYYTGAEASARWNERHKSRFTASAKLQSCPFCGGYGKVTEFNGEISIRERGWQFRSYAVVCSECECRTGLSDGVWVENHIEPDEDEQECVVKEWNRRADHPNGLEDGGEGA